MSKKYLFSIRDFSKGQIDKDAPTLIPNNALVEAKNAVIGRGYVSKRSGYQKYSNLLPKPINKLFEFYKKDGTKEFLAVSDNKLYKDNAGSLSAVSFSGISVLSSNKVQMVSYKDKDVKDIVLLADGGKLKIYNGTNVSEATAHAPTSEQQTDPGLNDLSKLTNFRAMAIKKDRIFAAAHPEVKNRLSFCHHDPTSGYALYNYFPATFFIDFATGDNDEIVQLEVFRDALVVLCKRSIWILYGDGRTIDDYEMHKINVPAGCIAPDSVQIVGNELFYLSDDHVYRMYATDQNFVSAKVASENVENALNQISRTDKEKAVGTFFNDRYYLSFPDGTTLVYDTLLDAWATWTNIKANSFLNREGVLYFGSQSGYIYRFVENTFNDDGAAIEFKMITKNFDFDYEVQPKKFKQMWVGVKQYLDSVSSYDFKAVIDYVDVIALDTTVLQGGVWDEADYDFASWDFVDVIQMEMRLREKGKNIQLIFENKKLNEPITIYGLAFQYKLKKP
ncbi:hypothetical protein KZX50_00515 [Bacillus infantis]|uniref:hypothetical protein n=1 Tax=Bacillus infantis TaxID=324767 RepID=UPI002003FBA9|nr:hypothetical protein [Bacillus infantis]MCK6203930.1 hypothetical protein [Bacillus infantis]